MKYEHCCKCDDLTGRAGRSDDSLYCEHCDEGPFCETCLDAHTCLPLVATLRRELEEAKAAIGLTLKGGLDLAVEMKRVVDQRDPALACANAFLDWITKKRDSGVRCPYFLLAPKDAKELKDIKRLALKATGREK